jgi:hypothetical protein
MQKKLGRNASGNLEDIDLGTNDKDGTVDAIDKCAPRKKDRKHRMSDKKIVDTITFKSKVSVFG